MWKYSQEIKEFIAANVKGKRPIDLAELTNQKFGTEFTKSKMRAFMKNHGLRNELPTAMKGERKKIFSVEIEDFIKENYLYTGHQAMADMVSEKFGIVYTKEQIKSFYAKNKLNSKLTGQFPKGYVPFNKGKKRYWVGSEATQFKKGNKPLNYMAVGSERVNADDYVDIKIADPNKWKGKHIIVWEEHNGPIPKGHVVIFGDRNKRNFELNNLICLSRQQLLMLNRNRLIQSDADVTKTAVIIADIKIKTSQRSKNA